MKKSALLFLLFLGVLISFAFKKQTPTATNVAKSLSPAAFYFMRDSCNQLDIVYSKGGSMSIDGRNVGYFTSFIHYTPAKPIPNKVRDGIMMWVKNGREVISGDFYFTSDTSAYIQFKIDTLVFANNFTKQGATFLQTKGR